MSDQATPDRTELPLDVLDQIDRICDQYEAAWAAGAQPRVEDYLGAIAAEYRTALLGDLLAEELDKRRRGGDRPQPVEYRARFPGDGALVKAALAARDD